MARQEFSGRETRTLGGRLSRAWKKLTTSEAELESADLQEAARRVGAQPIESCRDRDRVTLSGTVAKLTRAPQGEAPTLSVELRDGSGTVEVAWMGRRTIPGIETGTTIRVHGRVSCQAGHRTMYNPRYELIEPGTD
ncbi:OB-fold nucleic acid binding domain-containing protein [Propionibacteriaceae bacterium Y2011]|uniref:OB-fold nucleic acid binding domain-containing protein n=1 Tax=Microlunatus sp. Y2014 TaxID=3418488 RepID=UPI003B4B0149